LLPFPTKNQNKNTKEARKKGKRKANKENWLDTKENWIFSMKLYLMGRCFLDFLPNILLVVFNVISLYMHAFDI
jgi:hypothetical protein